MRSISLKLLCILLLTPVLYPIEAFSAETSKSGLGSFEILSPTLTEKGKKREKPKSLLEELLKEMRTKRKPAPQKDGFDRPDTLGKPDTLDLTSSKDDKKREQESNTKKAGQERIKTLFERATYEEFTPRESITIFNEETLE